jgi:hypothetical protein
VELLYLSRQLNGIPRRKVAYLSDFGSDHGTNYRCPRVHNRKSARLSATSTARPANACAILKNDVENMMKKPSPRSAATN